MCDYSLMAISNRLAVEGEELVVHRFCAGSLGLQAASTPPQGFWGSIKNLFSSAQLPVVCVPPRARLILRDIHASLQTDLGVGPTEEVVFTQITATENSYRDAVRFRNGKQVLVQKLRRGQRVRVLDLSSAEAAAEPIRVESRQSSLLMRVGP
jgi:hypothetical protein